MSIGVRLQFGLGVTEWLQRWSGSFDLSWLVAGLLKLNGTSCHICWPNMSSCLNITFRAWVSNHALLLFPFSFHSFCLRNDLHVSKILSSSRQATEA
jgi:hypothetical protein